jgi:hypothetical protein
VLETGHEPSSGGVLRKHVHIMVLEVSVSLSSLVPVLLRRIVLTGPNCTVRRLVFVTGQFFKRTV